jgi:hypothetical protein
MFGVGIIFGATLIAIGIYGAIADARMGHREGVAEGNAVRRNGSWIFVGAAIFLVSYILSRYI